LSPGYVDTDILVVSGYVSEEMKKEMKIPALRPEDVSETVMFLLSTPYTVNITELTIRPVGARM